MADIGDLRIEHGSMEPARMRTRRLALLALSLVLILVTSAAVAWALRGQRPNQHQPTPSPAAAPSGSNGSRPAASAASGFTAAGYLEVIPPGARIISSLIPGMVAQIKVQEGQPVRAGDVIATLDTSLLEREFERRAAEVEVLRARLVRLEAGYLPEEIAQAEARIEAAKARLHAAQEYLAALKRIAGAEGSITGAAPLRVILDTQAEVVLSSSALAEAEAELRIKQRGTRPEDLAIARAELTRAEIDLAHVRWKIEQCTIRSPTDGVVFQQLAQPGQWIVIDTNDARAIDGRGAESGGGGIVSVFDPAALQAWVDVNQRDVHRIRIGQRATLIAEAIPGKAIEGRVIQFMPRASIERNTVRIKISIEGEHEGLRPDMSLRVTFHEN